VKGTLRPSGIVKGIPPRLNKKAKTFNWAGGVNLRLEAKENSDVRLLALPEKPGTRIQDIFHQKAFHVPIPVIDINPVR